MPLEVRGKWGGVVDLTTEFDETIAVDRAWIAWPWTLHFVLYSVWDVLYFLLLLFFEEARLVRV